jgi:septum formation protein
LSLLSSIGIVPDRVVAADIDETPHKGELPHALAVRLANEKLQAVLGRDACAGAYVLAADTVVGVGRRILPKAETEADVRACLRLMAGRRHHVTTGVAIRAPDGRIARRKADSVVIFRQLSDADVEAYVVSGEGIGKAGGYAIQGLAATMIRFSSGSPMNNVMGLPLFEVAQMLRGLGWRA